MALGEVQLHSGSGDHNSRLVGMTPWLKGSLDSKLPPELGVV